MTAQGRLEEPSAPVRLTPKFAVCIQKQAHVCTHLPWFGIESSLVLNHALCSQVLGFSASPANARTEVSFQTCVL